MPNGFSALFRSSAPPAAGAGAGANQAPTTPPKVQPAATTNAAPNAAAGAGAAAPTPKPSAAPAPPKPQKPPTAAAKETESPNESKFYRRNKQIQADLEKATDELAKVKADSEKNEQDFIDALKKNLMRIYHINKDIAGSGNSFDEFKESAATTVKAAAGGAIFGYVTGKLFGKEEELSAVGGAVGLLAGLWSVNNQNTLRTNARKLLMIANGLDNDIKLIELRMEKIAKALCMRFLFAIHELRNSPDGLLAFANFFATSIATNIIDQHITEHKTTEENIICLTIECAIPNEHSSILRDVFCTKKVATKKDDDDWSIEGILWRSPILIVRKEQQFYVRDGKDNNKAHRYPPQIIIERGNLPRHYIIAREADIKVITYRLNNHSPHSLALRAQAQHKKAQAELSALLTGVAPTNIANKPALDELNQCVNFIFNEMNTILAQNKLQLLAYDKLPEIVIDGKAEDTDLALALIRHHYQHREVVNLKSIIALQTKYLADANAATPPSAPAQLPERSLWERLEDKWHFTQPLKIACSTMAAGYVGNYLCQNKFGRSWCLFFSLAAAAASNIYCKNDLYQPPPPQPKPKPSFSPKLTYY